MTLITETDIKSKANQNTPSYGHLLDIILGIRGFLSAVKKMSYFTCALKKIYKIELYISDFRRLLYSFFFSSWHRHTAYSVLQMLIPFNFFPSSNSLFSCGI